MYGEAVLFQFFWNLRLGNKAEPAIHPVQASTFGIGDSDMAATDFPSETIHKALAWRNATKHFDSTRKINDQDWDLLKKSLRLAPSSFGLQPWHFIVVQDPALRERLSEATWHQAQVTECSHMIVPVSYTHLRAHETGRNLVC